MRLDASNRAVLGGRQQPGGDHAIYCCIRSAGRGSPQPAHTTRPGAINVEDDDLVIIGFRNRYGCAARSAASDKFDSLPI
jgi:hypothetical protein